jgi:hypothetical protein
MKNAIFNYITFNKDININTINGIHSADGLYDHMKLMDVGQMMN